MIKYSKWVFNVVFSKANADHFTFWWLPLEFVMVRVDALSGFHKNCEESCLSYPKRQCISFCFLVAVSWIISLKRNLHIIISCTGIWNPACSGAIMSYQWWWCSPLTSLGGTHCASILVNKFICTHSLKTIVSINKIIMNIYLLSLRGIKDHWSRLNVIRSRRHTSGLFSRYS